MRENEINNKTMQILTSVLKLLYAVSEWSGPLVAGALAAMMSLGEEGFHNIIFIFLRLLGEHCWSFQLVESVVPQDTYRTQAR